MLGSEDVVGLHPHHPLPDDAESAVVCSPQLQQTLLSDVRVAARRHLVSVNFRAEAQHVRVVLDEGHDSLVDSLHQRVVGLLFEGNRKSRSVKTYFCLFVVVVVVLCVLFFVSVVAVCPCFCWCFFLCASFFFFFFFALPPPPPPPPPPRLSGKNTNNTLCHLRMYLLSPSRQCQRDSTRHTATIWVDR